MIIVHSIYNIIFMAYLILFFTAFLAGSLFPAQSEVLLLTLLAQNIYSVILLLSCASVGNILGSCFNWYLGTQLYRFQHKKWFPFSITQIQKVEYYYHKYGYISLLFSWLPIVGDPLTLIAGILKEKLWRFIVLVTIAKTARYVVLYLIFIQVI